MFYARKTTTKASPDSIENAIKVIQEQVIPAAQTLPGFVGGYWLGNRSTGDGLSFTFFESREALEASRQSADQIRAQSTQAIGAEVVSVDHFEVVANTGDKVHSSASHARVIEFGGDAGQLEASIQRIENNVIPAVREFPGFLGGFWLADRSSGKGVSVTLFDSEANLRGTAERANQLRGETARASGAMVGEPHHYEIFVRAPTMAGKAG